MRRMDEVHSPNGDFLSSGYREHYVIGPACLSVSGYVCPRTFVNSGRTDGPIWTGQTPKDAPKRRNDDGVCYVAPGATWHVPRAAA